MTDSKQPSVLPPTLHPAVQTVVGEAFRRGWLVRLLTENGDAADHPLAYTLIRQSVDETQVIVVCGPDSAAAFRTRDYTFEKAAEDAQTVTWSATGPASSMWDAIDTSHATSSPYPRPTATRLLQVAGASWAWLREGRQP